MTSLADSIFRAFSPSPRRVFFSLHYQRDIWRAQQVKNHWVAKETYTTAGFFDGSLEEKAKKEGNEAVKRLINKGLVGASVTCVLIGAETYNRRWVYYEIFKSIEEGMGVFGVRIHKLKDRTGKADNAGSNPFSFLGYGTREGSAKIWPKIHYTSGWKDAPHNGPINRAAAPYLDGVLFKPSLDRLDRIFSVYDWVDDDGYNNFSSWVTAATEQAGR